MFKKEKPKAEIVVSGKYFSVRLPDGRKADLKTFGMAWRPEYTSSYLNDCLTTDRDLAEMTLNKWNALLA